MSDPDCLAGLWIAKQTGLQTSILEDVDATVQDAGERRHLAVWRDLVEGVSCIVAAASDSQYMSRTLSTPLHNRARQYREYLSLSFAWLERAAMAERFSRYSSSFPTVALALHAMRLDCLLEAALAAFDLDLINIAEERQAWWWIYSIATARIGLPLGRTWRGEWTRSWYLIAAGMQSVSWTPVSQS